MPRAPRRKRPRGPHPPRSRRTAGKGRSWVQASEGGTLDAMSMSSPGRPGAVPSSPLKLEYPQSLAVYDDYAAAQKAVDFLSDEKFPVEHLMIVGTDLKRIERIT